MYSKQHSQFFLLFFRTVIAAAALLFSFVCQAKSNDAAEELVIKKSVEGLYQALSNKDASSFAQYLLPQGFTELNPEWAGVKRLDMAVFNSIFQSGAKIELGVSDIAVQKIDHTTAIVTGYRVGTITPPGSAAIYSRLALSMVWNQHQGQWKLVHVHLSKER